MRRIAAVIATPAGVPHEEMAASALQDVCAELGYEVQLEAEHARPQALSPHTIGSADVVILATDSSVETTRFAGKPVYTTSTAEAIRHTRSVVEAAIALAPNATKVAAPETKANESIAILEPPSVSVTTTPTASGTKKLVAITSCPTGIAHTFMAAQALEKAAKSLGYEIKVETQGSVGAKNTLTEKDISEADAVVIAADVKIDLGRFAGKRLYSTSTKDAMHHGTQVIDTALSQPETTAATFAQNAQSTKSNQASQRTGPYKHLMTGVSYMLPLLVAGGLCIALAFALGGIYAGDQKGSLAAALNKIGGETAFGLFVAVLSAFIAYSIADRPGLAPGLIGGMLAQNLGAGFLGGIASGFLAGYLTSFMAKNLRLPANLEGLKPVLILPFLSTLIVGLAMIFLIAPPVAAILTAMTNFLNSMRGTNAMLLGLLLGAMMAFDMGGPVNKAAYAFSVGLLASKVGGPMAAVIAAGMTPPLALALAATLFPNRFDEEDRQARGAAFALGLAFITEGAIPFTAKDPIRVIPSLMLGSGIAGAISMAASVSSLVPHGGVFAAVIPGALSGLPMWCVAVLAGTLVSTGALWILKKPVEQTASLVTAAEAA